ncbi:hypothetical protein ACFL6Q_04045 [Candidatus Neomarinimicrobiota bacterium]
MSPELSTKMSGGMPDFSDGEEFLGTFRGALRKHQRRRALAVSTLTTAGAVMIFVLSFTAIQRQVDEELWEDYLLSQTEEVVETEAVDEFAWDVYLEYLLQEDDLDVLLEEILSLENGEEWLQTIDLKG